MQSWGLVSRFSHRDTAREPSKSGVIGLLCAALGASRDDDALVARLAALPMGVRVNREGVPGVDFQTIGGGTVGGSPYGVARAQGGSGGTLLSCRDYLADADFLVGLHGDEGALLTRLDRALRDPYWPLYLGRRSYVPSVPPAAGVAPGTLEGVLRAAPAIGSRPYGASSVPGQVRLVLEALDGGGEPRYDVPISFHPQRRAFRVRYVRTSWVPQHVSARAAVPFAAGSELAVGGGQTGPT